MQRGAGNGKKPKFLPPNRLASSRPPRRCVGRLRKPLGPLRKRTQADLDHLEDKSSVIAAFYTYALAEQQREAEELIREEGLNAEAAKRYLTTSPRHEFATETGTELMSVLPKMSPLNPQYLTKKQSVLQRIVAFVEQFNGVGGVP